MTECGIQLKSLYNNKNYHYKNYYITTYVKI